MCTAKGVTAENAANNHSVYFLNESAAVERTIDHFKEGHIVSSHIMEDFISSKIFNSMLSGY